MRPLILFDKSFLQSLSVDESVWFDHFFSPVISPLFYVETLADLEKSLKNGRTPEQEVKIISNKFPEKNGYPCLFHRDICISELLGKKIPMNARIPMGGGSPVLSDRKQGIVYNESPESKAFHRWQEGEFLEVEKNYAKVWREALINVNLNSFGDELKKLGLDSTNCKSLTEAKKLSDKFLFNPYIQHKLIQLSLEVINVPQNLKDKILTKWIVSGMPPLYNFSPYTFFIMSIEVFFNVSIESNLISRERPSNKIDISYLFYLPFCNIFVSSDKLHKKCANLFLREDQMFLWGLELKNDLKAINEYYLSKPDSEKEKDLYHLAPHPPLDENFIVCELWDKFLPSWRKNLIERKSKKNDSSEIVNKINKLTNSPRVNPKNFNYDDNKLDFISIKRSVRKKKGNWWQLPKDLPPNK